MSQCAKCHETLLPEDSQACTKCENVVHFACAGFSETNFRKQSKARKEVWKCHNCKAPNSDADAGTLENQTCGELSIVDVKNLFDEFSACLSSKFASIEENIQVHSSQNIAILNELKELKVSFAKLQAKQETLLQENISLKKTINGFLESSVQAAPHVPSGQNPIVTYKSALKKNVFNSPKPIDKSNDTTKARLNNAASTTLSPMVPPVNIIASHSTSDSQIVPDTPQADNDMSQESWNEVIYKKKRQKVAPKIGTRSMTSDSGQSGSGSTLVRKVVTRKRTRALFVSRFSPHVSSQQIKEIVQGNVTLSQLLVSKIKCRYQSLYSSFYVEVLESEFCLVDDVNIWPDGCLIKEFFGKLLPDTVVPEDIGQASGVVK